MALARALRTPFRGGPSLVNDVRVHVFAFLTLRGDQRSSDFTSNLYLVISVVARRWKYRDSTAMADRTSWEVVFTSEHPRLRKNRVVLASGIRTSRRLTLASQTLWAQPWSKAVTEHVLQISLQCDAGVAVVWCSPSNFARNRAQTRSWSSPILESCVPRHGNASCGRRKMQRDLTTPLSLPPASKCSREKLFKW